MYKSLAPSPSVQMYLQKEKCQSQIVSHRCDFQKGGMATNKHKQEEKIINLSKNFQSSLSTDIQTCVYVYGHIMHMYMYVMPGGISP